MNLLSNSNEAFDNSYSRISEMNHEAFFCRFYDNLFAANPDIQARFAKVDMKKQFGFLNGSFAHMVDFAESNNADVLESLARRHGTGDLDIPKSWYGVWLSALIQTVREMDPAFDQKVEAAWRTTLAPGIDFMVPSES